MQARALQTGLRQWLLVVESAAYTPLQFPSSQRWLGLAAELMRDHLEIIMVTLQPWMTMTRGWHVSGHVFPGSRS
eukprot:675549-Rhodomonas_salina.1